MIISEEIDNIVIGILEFFETNNPIEILMSMGVQVIEVNSNSNLLLKNNSNTIIELNRVFIRDDLPENFKLFYLRHELGHIILHINDKNVLLPNTYRREKEADYFALKLSQLELDELMMYQMTYEQIASCLGIPNRVIKQLVNL